MGYDILPIEEIDTINFSEVDEDSADTVRKSIDESLFIVHRLGNTGQYSHAEILAILQTEEWNELETLD